VFITERSTKTKLRRDADPRTAEEWQIGLRHELALDHPYTWNLRGVIADIPRAPNTRWYHFRARFVVMLGGVDDRGALGENGTGARPMANLQVGGGSTPGGHSIGVSGKRTTFPRATLAAFLTSASLGVLSLAMPAVAQVRAESVSFDIPSQPINEALLAFARQAGVRLVMPDAQFGDVRSNAVRGAYDRDSALAELLRGTGVAARLENGAIVLQRSADASRPTQSAAFNETDDDKDKVVIVGTNIRGVYPSSSPVETYTAEDIARTGATTTEQFIQKLPQNLGTRTQYANSARGGLGTSNLDGVNSVDLRGLGVGTTLVLLNGRRLALASSGQTPDVSLIPTAALERVEVLNDGASAIYGSDAVGGVVNFVLRDDFDGAETRLSYGGVTSGGMRQGDFGQLLGRDWASGHGLVSFNYYSSSALERDERDYTAPAGPGTLTPHDTRYNALATLTQDLSSRLTLNADIVFSQREVKNVSSSLTSANPLNHVRSTYVSDTTQYFGNVGLDYHISDDMQASLFITYSDLNVDGSGQNLRFNRVPQTFTVIDGNSSHRGLDATAMLTGRLLTLPSGDMRYSIGAGQLTERYEGPTAALVPSTNELGRDTSYAFAEVFAPLVDSMQGVPLINRLELSVAARYTSYADASNPSLGRDFGDSVSPKIGLLWSPTAGLNLRTTYGESFRAPALSQLDRVGGRSNLTNFPVASIPSTILNVFAGPSGQLGSENAQTSTFGFDFAPIDSGIELGATYFNISYKDRIGIAPSGGLSPFTNPAALPDIIYRAPSAAYIEDLLRTTTNTLNTTGISISDPAAAAAQMFALPTFWIVDQRYLNLAKSEQDGVDVSASVRFDTDAGDVRLGLNATRIFSYRQQGSPNSPILSELDRVLKPADLRGRVFGSLSRGGFDATLSVNYTDDYLDTFTGGTPREVDSWTTADLNLAYEFGEGSLHGIRVGLSAQNIFDEDPPFVGVSAAAGAALLLPIGFDPANANPLGRILVLSVTKHW
jgi:iron complex outermembrane receptor protein